MQKTTENINVSKRRLEKACNYVSDLWFPVNSELLAKIKLGIKGGVYDLEPEALVSSITSDFSLFMYCLRELLSTLKSEGADIPPLANPVEALRLAGLDRLKQILRVDENKISRHSYATIDDFQQMRLEESLISASAAQTLAHTYKIDPDLGYSAALIRQLGHTLIAWNYPSIYRDAASAITKDNNLDVLLAERLGFSPALLAIRILVSWGIPIQLCEAVFLSDEDSTPEENEEATIQSILGSSLAKLCIIGETLARANNPKLYPTAKNDWELARDQIQSRLGKEGLRLIQETFNENLEDYITYMPEIFHGGLLLEPELHLAEFERDEITSRNPYLALCPPPLKTKLSAVYLEISPGLISEHGIRNIINTIIPMVGFTGGLIYSIDPGISMLVPQTQIGNVLFKDGQAIDYSIVLSNSDSIPVAFRSHEPVIEFHTNKDKELFAAISGVIGHSNRVGVLYLEVPHTLFNEKERDLIVAFKSFARAITDCLNLT